MNIKEIKFLLTHSSIYGLGTILSRMVALIMLPIYTRYLTPADYGILEMIDTTLMLIGLIVTIGISRSMSRFYYEEENVSYRGTVVSTTYLITFGISLVFFPVVFILSPFFSRVVFSSEIYTNYFIISFASLFLGMIIDIGMMYLRLIKKPIYFISLSVSRLLVLITLNIVFIVFLRKGVMGILLSTLITRIAYSLFLTSAVLWKTKLRFSYQLCLDIMKFCLPMIPANLFSTMIKQSDKYFVLYLMSLADAGIYSLALKLGNTIHMLITIPFIMAYVPRRFEIMKKADSNQTFSQIYTYYSFIFIFVGLSLSVLVPEILKIMATPKFYDAGKYIPLIVFSMFLFGCQYHFDFGILYSKKTKYFAYINFFIAALNISLNYVLITLYGIWGAICASVIVIGSQSLLYLLISNRYFKIGYEYWRILNFLVTAILFYFISICIDSNNLLIDIAEKMLLLVAFLLTVVLFKIITSEETSVFKRIFTERLGKIFHVQGFTAKDG